jgi:tripartite-type tricarboxylate transporter receptor subunit TctC
MIAIHLARRQILELAASAVALPALSRLASAQSYPSRPVRMLVGYAAGSSADIFARLLGQWLSERLGQQFVIENRPGAGTNIATETVVRSAPDGYTLIFAGPANAINATLYQKLDFDFIRDTAPVASVLRAPLVMEVHPTVPPKTVPEFIAYAKAHPGQLSMASGGIGVTTHVSGELFKMMTGVELVHVPYRGGGPALIDLVAGRVQVMFDVVASSLEHIRNGELRALAVTTSSRSEALPDIPVLAEFVPGYESSTWAGIAVPKNTPAQIIKKLNEETNFGLANPRFRARLTEFGGTVVAGSPEDFGRFIVAETGKWAKVVKFANIKSS